MGHVPNQEEEITGFLDRKTPLGEPKGNTQKACNPNSTLNRGCETERVGFEPTRV